VQVGGGTRHLSPAVVSVAFFEHLLSLVGVGGWVRVCVHVRVCVCLCVCVSPVLSTLTGGQRSLCCKPDCVVYA